MAITKAAKTEADLIRKVKIIDSSMSTLTTSLSNVEKAVDNIDIALITLTEQIVILNKYMAEIVGDTVE